MKINYKKINLDFISMEIKKLYTIGEEEFLPSEILLFINPFKYQSKRLRILSSFIKEINPEIIFYEGLKDEEKEEELFYAGFDGKIIWLDENCKEFNEYAQELNLLNFDFYDDLINSNNLSTTFRKYQKRRVEVVRKYEEKYKVHLKREMYWIKKIKDNYQPNSLLICNLAHVCSGINALKIFPYSPLLTLKTLQERKEEKIGMLGEFLKQKGIKVEIKATLPSF